MRLIDAGAVLYELDEMPNPTEADLNAFAKDKSTAWLKGVCDAMDCIRVAPTIDAVEVVRCKECKFAVMTTDGQLKYCKERDPHCTDKLYYSGDDFCSRGERK